MSACKITIIFEDGHRLVGKCKSFSQALDLCLSYSTNDYIEKIIINDWSVEDEEEKKKSKKRY